MDERELVVLIQSDDHNSQSPLLLRWDIVSKCNLSCSHCCVGDMLRDDTKVDLTTEEIFRGLENAARGGIRQVHFLGGEPTIRRDFIQIMQHARGCGLDVSFNTNGIRQDTRFLESLIEINPIGITVSLDGPDAASHDTIRGRGTFEKTTSFIRKLVELRPAYRGRRPKLQIQSVLTAHWVLRAGEIIALAHRLSADAVVVNHLAKIGDAITNASTLGITPIQHFKASLMLLSAMSQFPHIEVTAPIRLKVIQFYREFTGDRSTPLQTNQCPAIDENSQVNYDGTITPCQLAQSYGLYDEGNMPSILDEVGSAWDTFVFSSFKRQVKDELERVYENQIPCNRCHFLGRGCRPCPLPDDPTLYKTNYQCLIAEALLKAGHDKAKVSQLTEAEVAEIMEKAIEDNPARKRPDSDFLFPDVKLRLKGESSVQ
ncbi:radical SAM protein [Bradyrhizobium sp. 2TAF36]|uniref:radical SAM protein n=1 Tax=Bradyrhizobium sp. 2TAF36 TaxID=3233016 RepID=UPI003F8EBB4B